MIIGGEHKNLEYQKNSKTRKTISGWQHTHIQNPWSVLRKYLTTSSR